MTVAGSRTRREPYPRTSYPARLEPVHHGEIQKRRHRPMVLLHRSQRGIGRSHRVMEAVDAYRLTPKQMTGCRRRGQIKTDHWSLQVVGTLSVGDRAALGIDVFRALQLVVNL